MLRNFKWKLGILILMVGGVCGGEEKGILFDGAEESDRDANYKVVIIKGFIQSLAYLNMNDGSVFLPDQFLLRRARLDTRIRINSRIGGRLQVDMAPTARLLDAYIQLRFLSPLMLQIGQFKSPVSRERQQSVPSLAFNDFAYTASLAPNRDLGILVGGTFFSGSFQYKLALLNGASNGPSLSADLDHNKDLAAQFVIKPFTWLPSSCIRSLSLGIGASTGRHPQQDPGSLRSVSRHIVFSYMHDILENGTTTRIAPHVAWFGPKGMFLSEVLFVSQMLNDTLDQTMILCHEAWTVSAGYVLCGGERSDKGFKPKEVFDPAKKQFGGLELAFRAHGFIADPAGFDAMLYSMESVQNVITVEAGLSWYFAENSCVKLIYSFSTFDTEYAMLQVPDEHLFSISTHLTF
jgi:phosphate-selective porin OprO and OprP